MTFTSVTNEPVTNTVPISGETVLLRSEAVTSQRQYSNGFFVFGWIRLLPGAGADTATLKMYRGPAVSPASLMKTSTYVLVKNTEVMLHYSAQDDFLPTGTFPSYQYIVTYNQTGATATGQVFDGFLAFLNVRANIA